MSPECSGNAKHSGLAEKAQAKRGRRVRPKQTSFRAPEIQSSQEELRHLQQLFSRLAVENLSLRTKLKTCETKLAAADDTLLNLLSAQTALGYQAHRLAHAQRRQLSTVAALPPPAAWTPDMQLNTWTSDQIRYLLFHSYQDLGIMAQQVLRGRMPIQEMTSHLMKSAAFSIFSVRHNSQAWARITGCNLFTGEMDGATSSWYIHAAQQVPQQALSPELVAAMHKAMSVFQARVMHARTQRARLKSQLGELAPQTLQQLQHKGSRLQWHYQLPQQHQSSQHQQPDIAHNLSVAPAHSQLVLPLPAAAHGHVVHINQVDDLLEQLTKNVVDEVEAGHKLFEAVWTKLPPIALACLAHAGLPYHLHFASSMIALYGRICGTSPATGVARVSRMSRL